MGVNLSAPLSETTVPMILFQLKEMVALLALIWLIVHTYRKVIPDLMTKRDQELSDALEHLNFGVKSLTESMGKLERVVEVLLTQTRSKGHD